MKGLKRVWGQREKASLVRAPDFPLGFFDSRLPAWPLSAINDEGRKSKYLHNEQMRSKYIIEASTSSRSRGLKAGRLEIAIAIVPSAVVAVFVAAVSSIPTLAALGTVIVCTGQGR